MRTRINAEGRLSIWITARLRVWPTEEMPQCVPPLSRRGRLVSCSLSFNHAWPTVRAQLAKALTTLEAQAEAPWKALARNHNLSLSPLNAEGHRRLSGLISGQRVQIQVREHAKEGLFTEL